MIHCNGHEHCQYFQPCIFSQYSIVSSFPSRYQSLMVDIYFQSCTHMRYVTSLAYWLPKLNFHSYLQYVEYLTKNDHLQPALGRIYCTKIAKTYPKFLNPRQKLLVLPSTPTDQVRLKPFMTGLAHTSVLTRQLKPTHFV